jgi:hypothetical protein
MTDPDLGKRDALFSDLLRAGESVAKVREILSQHEPDDANLAAVLRRGVPFAVLEAVAASPPWSERPVVLGAIVRNPRTRRSLAMRLLPNLYWRDVAEVAASPPLHGALRVRAEAILAEKLEEMRLGERVALARVATPRVLRLLLKDPDPKVLEACLPNPRLTEEELLMAIRLDSVPVGLLESAAASYRWGENYAVRLALVLQTRTPLPVALAQITSLLKSDLLRVSETSGLTPLVQAAALRVLREGL